MDTEGSGFGPDSNMDVYRAVFENAPDPVICVDADGKVVHANPEAERALGYGRGELAGLQVEALIPKRFANAHPAHRERFMADPHTRRMGSGMRMSALRKDGSEFPVDIMLSAAEGPDGVFAIVSLRDLTEKVAAEARLAELAEKMRLTELAAREEFERAQAALIAELQASLREIKVLRGLLPICAYCKNIRDESGTWQPIENFLHGRTEAEFSHGICPHCARAHFAEFLAKSDP